MDWDDNYSVYCYPNGRVNHKWKPYPLNENYLRSRCGETVAAYYPIEKSGIPKCKKCFRTKKA